MSDGKSAIVRRDVPVPYEDQGVVWGSDAIALLLRELKIPYVLLNPGASFRGLHDSIVNYLGNEQPQMIVVLHEEHAIAIAHGYTKVSGQMLGAIVHSNVGLMHASMGIFNAWADRVPVLVMGATGPVDAARRRPWIDWLHTAQDQGALVRNFTKWDAQPASVPAAFEALLRAAQISRTAPCGPTYVCFDVSVQETQLSERPVLPDVSRYLPAAPSRPSDADVATAAEWLSNANRPVILMGRVSRGEQEWRDRVALAEALGARVLTDLKLGAAFPTDHRLHSAAPGFFLSKDAAEVLRSADVVLSLDWVDLAGTLKQAWGGDTVDSRIIQVSVDQYIHNGWSMDHQGLPPVDLYLMSEPAPAVGALIELVQAKSKARPETSISTASNAAVSSGLPASDTGTISIASLARTLRHATEGSDVCLIRLPLGWNGEMWDFRHPLDYLGYDGGGGIGSGPGMAVGAALALKGTGRLPVAIIGDGDYMMGVSALWTAANARIPLLIIVSNNRSFFNDEIHQERVAKDRNRPVENRWIGQRIADPEPDLSTIARGQGVVGIGPVEQPEDLDAAIAEAVHALRGGKTVVVDVRVTPGYSASMSTGMTRSHAA